MNKLFSKKTNHKWSINTKKIQSLTIREIYIKATLRYHLILVRMILSKKKKKDEVWGDSGWTFLSGLSGKVPCWQGTVSGRREEAIMWEVWGRTMPRLTSGNRQRAKK